MALRGKRAVLGVTAAAAMIWLVSAVLVAGQGAALGRQGAAPAGQGVAQAGQGVAPASQGAAPAGPLMSENVFKDIRVLKGIPADEFIDAMGMFASSLGYDCTGCHDEDILNNRASFAITTPQIQTARRMVTMVNTLNASSFGGRPRVTCFTCHRGGNSPEVVPDFRLQYGEPPDYPNRMNVIADPRTSPDEVFKKYWQALGGRDRLTKLTSFVATGTYAGFNTGDRELPVEIFAKAPNLRTQIVKTFEGPAITAFDGTSGWISEGWRQLPLITLTGDNLAGAKLDLLVAFPAGLQAAFSQWKGSSATLDDHQVVLLQGSNSGEPPVNLYFDNSGMLVRVVRWRRTPVGSVPTEMDFADYREVAGIKMPFKTVITWTSGRNTIELDKVQPNVAIDASKFTRPAPFPRP